MPRVLWRRFRLSQWRASVSQSHRLLDSGRHKTIPLRTSCEVTFFDARSRPGRQTAPDVPLIRAMEATTSRKLTCQICGRGFSSQNGAIGENVRPSLAEFIKSKQPNWDPQGFICFGDLGAFRRDYVKCALEDEIGELTTLDHEVIESLRQHEVLSENIEKQFERKLTFGEHLSD